MAYSTALEEEEEAGWQCCMPPEGSFGVLSHAQGAAEGVRTPHSQHNAFSVGFLSTQIVVSNGTLRGAQRVPRASSKHPGSRQSVLIRARHVL